MLTTTVDLPNFPPLVKTFMTLTYLNIKPELLSIMVASNLGISAEAHPWDTCHPQRDPLLPQVRVGGQHLVNNDMVWRPVSHTITAQ